MTFPLINTLTPLCLPLVKQYPPCCVLLAFAHTCTATDKAVNKLTDHCQQTEHKTKGDKEKGYTKKWKGGKNMCFTLDRDEGDADGAQGAVGLVWLRSTPQLFDGSTSKRASRHTGWFISNCGRSEHIRGNRSWGVWYMKRAQALPSRDRKDEVLWTEWKTEADKENAKRKGNINRIKDWTRKKRIRNEEAHPCFHSGVNQ